MATENLYPAIRPSLDLNFAGSKALDPRITFSRASAATYYDGKTVAKAEENLLTYSQQITAGVGAWAGQGLATGTTVNSAQAPDATVTASTINVTSGAGGVRYYSTIPAGTYTVSVYIRSVSGSTDFAIDFENLYSTSFTLSSVWQRVTATVTFAVTRTWIDFQISAPGVFEIWGAQLEQRSQVTAYTPTTTQPITNYIPVLQTAQAGVPRFDHNSVTGESLGLLVEEQRTNLLTYSEQFDHTNWNKTSTVNVTSNASSAPDGSFSADKLLEILNSVNPRALQTYSQTVGNVYSFSMFVKASERTQIRLSAEGSAFKTAYFNLLTGAIVSQGSGLISAASVAVGNGWYRCSITWTAAVAQSDTYVGTAMQGAPATGDGFSGVFVWGAQLEAGSFPTSYIKTEASQVTRAADSASMTGANFSSWYRQDEGTLVANCSISNSSAATAGVICINDNTSTNQISLRLQAGNSLLLVNAGGVTQASANAGATPTLGLPIKHAGAYRANDFSTSLNGVTPTTDIVGSIPLANQIRIGALDTGTLHLNGHIKRITYYPKRLTDAQLQALTA